MKPTRGISSDDPAGPFKVDVASEVKTLGAGVAKGSLRVEVDGRCWAPSERRRSMAAVVVRATRGRRAREIEHVEVAIELSRVELAPDTAELQVGSSRRRVTRVKFGARESENVLWVVREWKTV